MTSTEYITWLRAQTGPQPLLLVYTLTVVFDDAGNVLLVQYRDDPDLFGLPGGMLEQDEDLAGCARREVFEETGLDVEIARLVGVYAHPDYTFRYPHGDVVQPWTVCFTGRVVGGRPHPDGREILDLCYLPPDEAVPHIPPQHRQALRDALRGGPAAVLEPVVLPPAGQPGYVATLRRHVRSACIIAPGATAVVRNEAGHVLITRRRDFGTWDMPGGWCELGETATGTVVRETREETGLEVRPVRLVGVYSNPAWTFRYPNGDQMRPVGAMFECAIVGGELRADGEETLDVAFVDPGGRGEHVLDASPLHAVFWHDVNRPRPEPYIR